MEKNANMFGLHWKIMDWLFRLMNSPEIPVHVDLNFDTSPYLKSKETYKCYILLKCFNDLKNIANHTPELSIEHIITPLATMETVIYRHWMYLIKLLFLLTENLQWKRITDTGSLSTHCEHTGQNKELLSPIPLTWNWSVALVWHGSSNMQVLFLG